MNDKDIVELHDESENQQEVREEESNAARRLRVLGDKAIPQAPDTALSRAEKKKKNTRNLPEERLTQREDVVGDAIGESNAAKRIRVLTADDFKDEPEKPIRMDTADKITNFWYHHKWKVIIGTFFAVIFGICIAQFASKTTPDICMMYVGPQYINASDNESINRALTSVMSDYNSDGKVGLQFATIVYLNEDQVKAKEDAAHARGEYFVFDAAANSSNLEQFNYEVMTGNTVIFLLDPAMYEDIMDKGMGIFLKLSDVFDELPDAAIDEYGIRLGDTELYSYFTALKNFPRDTVLCIRDVRTMSFYKGKKKMSDILERHVQMMRDLVMFSDPEQ